ncbi:sensor domain-containing diguanylate cyclase [Yokenella regensburgei]|uniref:sensor domain-containing diguanylate cyclase n=1 Tax=Yokenella regensburgei TaxID=158877 RepID=UPI00289B218C|nr:sensor domain-containing diguanylate cyclase [Yokenella regensburgei]
MSDHILARVSQTLSTEQSLESLVRQLLEMLAMVTDMESTYLTRIDEGMEFQHVLFARNSGDMQIPEGLSVPWDKSLCKRAFDDRCFFSDDVDTRWHDCEAAQALGIKTFFSTPIHLTDGSLYGTLCATSSERHSITLRGDHVLHLFAGMIARHIERESLVKQLREANAALTAHSYTDELTSLPNRRALFEHLPTLFSLARHLKRHLYIAFIDLDNFKAINDLYGHQAGDEFLRQVSTRLTACCCENDILARLGGDEFLFASLCTETPHDLAQFCETLRERIRGEYQLTRLKFDYPGASIGLVDIDPNESSADDAVRAADDAMYLDKKNRRQMHFSAASK